jgi:hypothetical protein
LSVNGKKPTSTQRKVLTRNGVPDPENYLYVGIRHVDTAGYRHPGKTTESAQTMVFRHRETGQEVSFSI